MMHKMKRLRLILVALAVMIVSVAMATEPSKITVRYHGKRYYIHQVKEGDTLYSLASVYGVSQESIIEVNGLEGDTLRLGDKLYVLYGNVQSKKKHSGRDNHAEGEDVHVVRPGETLYSLSRTYGMTEQDMLELNGLKDHTDIKAGMTLRVKDNRGEERKNRGAAEAEDVDAESHESVTDNPVGEERAEDDRREVLDSLYGRATRASL